MTVKNLIPNLIVGASLCLQPAAGVAQTLDPSAILKPLSDNWPTYSGDYSGMRHSRLTQVNQSNVKNLTLAWTARVTAGSGAAGGGGFGGRGGAPTMIGGEGSAEAGGNASIRAS